MVQLREKDLSGKDLYALARRLRDLTARYDALLLINDRVDVARAVRADGVHLPQASFPPQVARDILGKDALIGVSTHSLEEARAAQEAGADVITFGPVYETPSKRAYGPPVGIEALTAVCREIPVPVYALGGMKQENLAEVTTAGASGVAMISAILAQPDPEQAARSCLRRLAAGDSPPR